MAAANPKEGVYHHRYKWGAEQIAGVIDKCIRDGLLRYSKYSRCEKLVYFKITKKGREWLKQHSHGYHHKKVRENNNATTY